MPPGRAMPPLWTRSAARHGPARRQRYAARFLISPISCSPSTPKDEAGPALPSRQRGNLKTPSCGLSPIPTPVRKEKPWKTFGRTWNPLIRWTASSPAMGLRKDGNRLLCRLQGRSRPQASRLPLSDDHSLRPTFQSRQSRLCHLRHRICAFSRFVSKKEQEENIEKIRKGEFDLVIGTHRLLSDDIVFKDLGLLIIDEEQKFGVAHKEKIKEKSKNIDCLTLTATPIPRTMQMSLLNVRSFPFWRSLPSTGCGKDLCRQDGLGIGL